MIERFKNYPILSQILMPIYLMGTIGIAANIYLSIFLSQSISDLRVIYEEGDKKFHILENLEGSTAEFRALSLRHLASESAATMQQIQRRLTTVQEETQATLTALPPLRSTISNTTIAQDLARLPALLERYFGETKQAVALSADFEKEHAFQRLSQIEARFIPEIYDLLHRVKQYEYMEIEAARKYLMSTANRNLHITISIAIVNGGLVLLIAYFVARRITRRLGQLLNWSKLAAQGDLLAPLDACSEDEVGQLTSAMKEMAINIHQAHWELGLAKLNAEETAETLRIYANAFDKSGEAILITDKNNKIIDINSAFTRQTGYIKSDVLGKDPKILSSGDTPPDIYHQMWEALSNRGFWQGELWDKKKSGEIYPKWTAISAISNEKNEPVFYLASFTDISERKEAEKHIEHLAHHDILTGLHNRFSLEERLKQSLAMASRENKQMAVLFIDLDRFKNINDSLGHHIGDQLLIEVAERLKGCVRESDILARIGGDEFVIVLTSISSSNDAATVAEKILRSFSQPYLIDDNALETSPSIGICLYPDDATESNELMRCADVAMYHAKEQGRNNYHFFTDSMLQSAHERIQIEQDLRHAVTHDELELYYQPQLRATDERTSSVEALVRWNHPQQGLIMPMTFIPLAEETGIILDLGAWVINEACRQLAEWEQLGINDIHIAINLSTRQLMSEQITDTVRSTIARHGLSGEKIELEITETAAMTDPKLAIERLNALRTLGVKLAIDDFGTGYSSLSYLRQLPIQTLKLDRSFVMDIENNPNDEKICLATLALAKNLGLKVVAEGVSSEAQRQFLIDNQCDFLQGYYYSKPLPAEKATEHLLKQTETG